MTTATRSKEYYIERIEKHMLKKYPGMRFEVEPAVDGGTIIYCFPAEPVEDTYDITKRAGNLAVKALVESGFQFYVMSGD